MTLLAEIQTSILLARRARYLSTGFWLIVAVFIFSLMAAQFSGRQPATVALDVGLSSIRLLLPILVILLVQELISREFDRRYFLTSFTYPRPRHILLIGRVSTILVLAYFILFVAALLLQWMSYRIGIGYEQATPPDLGAGFWITIALIAIDIFVLTTMATLLGLVASTPSFVLIGTLGFMVVSRSYSNVIALLERERYLFLDNTETYHHSLKILEYLFPDLGALDVRVITLYAKPELMPNDWHISMIGCLVYAVALLAISHIYLGRKQFN